MLSEPNVTALGQHLTTHSTVNLINYQNVLISCVGKSSRLTTILEITLLGR